MVKTVVIRTMEQSRTNTKHSAITQEYKTDLAEKIVSHTVHLTRVRDITSDEEAVGTGVLVSYKNAYFILSSGHTFLDSPADEIGINLNQYWHRIQSFGKLVYFASEDALEDDFSVVMLNENISEKIQGTYSPHYLFSKDFKLIEYTPQLFTLMGFPGKKYRYHPVRKQYVRIPYASWMSSLSNEIKFFKGSTGANLFDFSFNRLEATKGPDRIKQIFPEMPGVSGSGLFAIKTDYSLEYTLMGIVNRYSEKNSKVLGYHISNFQPVMDSLLLDNG